MARIPNRPRSDDDVLLLRIWMRCNGHSASEVAEHQGVPRNTVISSTFAVMKADEAHDPKDFDRSAYW